MSRHSCMWSAATELAQLSEDTAGCLEYLMTILQEAGRGSFIGVI